MRKVNSYFKNKLSFKLLIIFSILFLASLLLSGCTQNIVKTEKTEQLMSTYFTITIYTPESEKENAQEAMDEAFLEIKNVETLLNYYSNDSEVTILNINKEIKNPSVELFDNVKKSVEYGKLSDGAFDITVQPILDLYTKTFGIYKRPPTDAEVKDELKKIDYSKIIVNDNKISIGVNQEITLGGIAKGYSVEKAVEVLKKYNITHALVNAGGNMRAIGEKYGDEKWNVALENPRDKSDYITIIKLNNNAVSTSGDYERYFDENKTFHHIINPKTGYSATELMSVTIVTDNAFDADALSTTVFVLGKEKGLKLIEELPNVEGLIITRDKEIIKSSGFVW